MALVLLTILVIIIVALMRFGDEPETEAAVSSRSRGPPCPIITFSGTITEPEKASAPFWTASAHNPRARSQVTK